MAKIIDTFGKYLIVALITLAMFIFFRSVERKPLLADDNTSFVRAVVTQNDNEDLQAEASLDSGDSQKVVLLIKSGGSKGYCEPIGIRWLQRLTRIAINANQSQACYNKVYHTKHPA